MNTWASAGLEYKLLSNGTAILRGIGSCSDENIVIPAKIGSHTVVSVSKKAFYRNDRIKSVTLPSSVKLVDDQAFAWCQKLDSIQLYGVVEIGERAFMGCDRLCNAELFNGLQLIGDKAFAYCPALTSVKLPDSVTKLGVSSFEGCRNLTKIALSQSLRYIENGTFYACSSLCKVIIPRDLEYIDEYAFAYCDSITEIKLPSKTVVNGDAFFECGNRLTFGKVS